MNKGHDQPLNLTKEELKTAGKLVGYLRIVVFEKGAYADGETTTHEMIVGVAKLMKNHPDLRDMLITAVKLYEALEQNPLLERVLDLIMSNSPGGEDCQCPACQMMRATKGQKGYEN